MKPNKEDLENVENYELSFNVDSYEMVSEDRVNPISAIWDEEKITLTFDKVHDSMNLLEIFNISSDSDLRWRGYKCIDFMGSKIDTLDNERPLITNVEQYDDQRLRITYSEPMKSGGMFKVTLDGKKVHTSSSFFK